ncbi:hypothetical protein BC830DRAFT_1116103 [Chytriomyces sp. MP71]|nr:hypothetical protein BC830DRAFT_1116103 [Chytriomyces sp. MP71]
MPREAGLPPLGPKYTWTGWANQQSYVSGFFIACGGILTVIFFTRLPGNTFALPVGIAQIVGGLLIMAIEHPFPGITSLGPAYTNLWARIPIYLAVLVAAMLQCPGQTGGLCLLCAIITTVRAAAAGESAPVPKKKGGGDKKKVAPAALAEKK